MSTACPTPQEMLIRGAKQPIFFFMGALGVQHRYPAVLLLHTRASWCSLQHGHRTETIPISSQASVCK